MKKLGFLFVCLSVFCLLSGCLRVNTSYALMGNKEDIQSIAIYNVVEAIEYENISAFSDPVAQVEPTQYYSVYEDIAQLPFGKTYLLFFGHNLTYRDYVVEITYTGGRRNIFLSISKDNMTNPGVAHNGIVMTVKKQYGMNSYKNTYSKDRKV